MKMGRRPLTSTIIGVTESVNKTDAGASRHPELLLRARVSDSLAMGLLRVVSADPGGGRGGGAGGPVRRSGCAQEVGHRMRAHARREGAAPPGGADLQDVHRRVGQAA